MKYIRKTLAFLLAFVLILSCLGTGALAESKYGIVDENGNGGLLVFGDSISRGCGACPEDLGGPRGPNDNYEKFQYRNVYGSYPYLLAKELGCIMPDEFTPDAVDELGRPANYWPACYRGQSLHMTMKWLGIDDGWNDGFVDHGWDMYPEFEYQFGSVDNLIACIEKASLIVVEQGMSDVFFRIFKTVDLNEPDILKLVDNLLTSVYEGYEHWKNEFPVFINYLREHNKNAQIVILGSFNPVEGMRISEESMIPVGNAISALSALMNRDYEKWMQTYRCTDKKISFVDISNVETPTNVYNMALDDPRLFGDNDLMGSVHPDTAGYAYIYRQILAALPEEELAPVCPLEPIINVLNNDIKLDLGRFTHVNYVLLDGKTAKYSMDNPDNPFELTVHCNKRTAKNLTIAVVQEDGKIALYTYQLSYKNGEYSTFRIYSTNNSVKTVTSFFKSITSVGSSILKAFSKLFKK